MPGCGKSTAGRELARRLGGSHVDLDQEIELRAGCSIPTLFARSGEGPSRDMEASVLVELVDSGAAVIATGGGVVLRPANRELLRTRTRCVYLRASNELLWRRLRRDRRRPLLQVADPQERLRAMSAERAPLYEDTAAIVIDTDGLSFDHLVERVIERLVHEAQR
jgi:shikimate kinase